MNRRLWSWRRAALGGAVGLVGILSACGDGAAVMMDGGADAALIFLVDLAPPSCPSPASFATIKVGILQSCDGYGCHRMAPFAGGLDLTDANAYASLVGVQAMKAPELARVKPGAPLDSFLWRKLDAQLSTAYSQGSPMPLGAENIWFPLSAPQRAQVYCWIQAGALNN